MEYLTGGRRVGAMMADGAGWVKLKERGHAGRSVHGVASSVFNPPSWCARRCASASSPRSTVRATQVRAPRGGFCGRATPCHWHRRGGAAVLFRLLTGGPEVCDAGGAGWHCVGGRGHHLTGTSKARLWTGSCCVAKGASSLWRSRGSAACLSWSSPSTRMCQPSTSTTSMERGSGPPPGCAGVLVDRDPGDRPGRRSQPRGASGGQGHALRERA
jgi:hypothetical protein